MVVAGKGRLDVPLGTEEKRMKKPFFQRVKRHLSRIYLRPIRVFVFHQVSDKFEPETMWECDWTQTDVFKRNMSSLMKKFTFLSLPEVCEHLAKDKIRLKNYAALTADDGWYSLTNILPWLTERRIPVTLFLNPSCLDGQHWNSRETDHLLTEEQVRSILEKGKPFISIASHGWTHKNSKEMTMEEFEDSVMMSEEVLDRMPGKVPFFAFASGRHTSKQVSFLKDKGLIPVFMDGKDNEKESHEIHRYCLDGESHDF